MADINELLFKIESTDAAIWREAIDRLKEDGTDQARRILMQIITTSPDLGKKYYAKKILGEMPQSVNVKTENKSDISSSQKNETEDERIARYLRTDNHEVQIKTIMHIAKYKLSQHLKALQELAAQPLHPFVRATIVKGLAYLGKEKCVRNIVPFLKDDDNRVRANAIEALEITGASGITEYILPMLNDTDNRVKINAMKVIEKIDRDKVINIVRSMLARDEEYYVNSSLFLIESLNIVEVREQLENIRDHSNPEIREKVARLLNNDSNEKNLENKKIESDTIELSGKISKIILERGFIFKSDSQNVFGVLLNDVDRLSPEQYINITGKVINEDGFNLIIPDKISRK